MKATLARLLQTHARIDLAIEREHRRPRPDALEATRLKKLKLRIKDLIASQFRPAAQG